MTSKLKFAERKEHFGKSDLAAVIRQASCSPGTIVYEFAKSIIDLERPIEPRIAVSVTRALLQIHADLPDGDLPPYIFPLTRLPPEILSNIFRKFVQKEGSDVFDGESPRRAMTLSHVCRNCEDFARDCVPGALTLC